MKFLIYGLIDPRTQMIRYVGLSATGLRRPRAHRNPSRLCDGTYKARWLSRLLAEGLDYGIAVLDTVENIEALPDAERWWIAFGRACGWPLTNGTDGGDGALNPSAETRAKRSLTLRGRRFTKEHRERIGAAQRGVPKSREAVAKTALALTGRKRSRESIDKQFASRKGYKHSAETIAKIRASNLGKKRPPSVGLAVAESNRRRATQHKEWLR